MRWSLLSLLPMVLWGCGADTPYGGLSSTAGFETTRGELTVSPTFEHGDVLLDARAGVILIGHPRPAIENADPELAMDLRLVGPTRATLPEHAASSATLTSTGALITSDERGEIRMGDRVLRRADGLELAGPIGLSADERHLLYCQGRMPDFEVWAIELESGEARQLTVDMAPAWSPAMTADGRLFFVSAKSGVPALWLQDDGRTTQVTNRGVVVTPGVVPDIRPTPAALSATRADDDVIAFESQGNVYVIDHKGQSLATITGATGPFWQSPGVLGALVHDGKTAKISTVWSAP